MSPLRDWNMANPPLTSVVNRAMMMVTTRIGSNQGRHQGFCGFGSTGAAVAGVCCSGFDVGVLEVMVKARHRGCPHGSHSLEDGS